MPAIDPQTSIIDWQQIHDDILCPLCDYNLRGLPEPRCPECGYRFNWQELLDPTRRHHPFLFEHHPERKLGSLFKTLVGGFRPKKFWTSLYPSQRSRLGLLAFYWLLTSFPLLILLIAGITFDARTLLKSIRQQRAVYVGWYTNPASSRNLQLTRGFPNRAALDRWLDSWSPEPPNPEFFRLLLLQTLRGRTVIARSGPIFAAPFALLLLLWPWLTFLALMVFQFSMRRARIRTTHVLRCIIYSSDIAFCTAAAAFAVAALWIGPSLLFGGAYRSSPVNQFLFLIALLYIVLFTYRLASAYRRYLKFDWPTATVLSTQLIVALFVFTFVLRLALNLL
jgi:hypothetical protein